MTRRMTALVLALAVLLCAAGAACAEGARGSTTPFQARLTSKAGLSAREGIATSAKRALITVLLCADYLAVNPNGDSCTPDFNKSSFVGKMDATLVVYLHAPAKDVVLTYESDTGRASYVYMDSQTDLIADIILKAMCTDGCYKNDAEELDRAVREFNNQ